jgi:predicted glycogen debranching enzyme
MLPNLFPDQGDVPQFNSVDASLWYIIACHEYLEAMKSAQRKVRSSDRDALVGAIQAILSGYSRGTRYGIHRDGDGLLAAGELGVQLTWMDAKVGDWVVTPRIGKPVEAQALWLNSLWIGAQFSERWQSLFECGKESFETRFWNPARNCLHDVVDADHRSGELDDSLRPNQIFAVGGLPLQLISGDRARQIVDVVEEALFTPIGLRSLEPGTAGYAPHYLGGVRARDGSYHQGTVWPWLIGPFVEAWIRVRGNTDAAKKEACEQFLPPLMEHLDQAGLGHVSEIADGDSPHIPRGCPFQAWSIGELLRLTHVVLTGRQSA